MHIYVYIKKVESEQNNAKELLVVIKKPCFSDYHSCKTLFSRFEI